MAMEGDGQRPPRPLYLSEVLFALEQHYAVRRLCAYVVFVGLVCGLLVQLVKQPDLGALRHALDGVATAQAPLLTPSPVGALQLAEEQAVRAEDVPQLVSGVLRDVLERAGQAVLNDTFVAPRVGPSLPARVFAASVLLPAELDLQPECNALTVYRTGCNLPVKTSSRAVLEALAGYPKDLLAPYGEHLRATVYASPHLDRSTVKHGVTDHMRDVVYNASALGKRLTKQLTDVITLVRPPQVRVELLLLTTRTDEPFRYTLSLDHMVEWKARLTSDVSLLRTSLFKPWYVPRPKQWFEDDDVLTPVMSLPNVLTVVLLVVTFLAELYWLWDFYCEWCAVAEWSERYRLARHATGAMRWVAPEAKVHPEGHDLALVVLESKDAKQRKRCPTPVEVLGWIKSLCGYMTSFEEGMSAWPLITFFTRVCGLYLFASLLLQAAGAPTAPLHFADRFPTTPEFMRQKCTGQAARVPGCNPDFAIDALRRPEGWSKLLDELEGLDGGCRLLLGLSCLHAGLVTLGLLRLLHFHEGFALFGRTVAFAVSDLVDASVAICISVVAFALPLGAVAVYVAPGVLGSPTWYYDLPGLKVLHRLFQWATATPYAAPLQEDFDKIREALGRRLQEVAGSKLAGPSLVSVQLPHSVDATSGSLAVRFVVLTAFALFLVLAANFLTAVVLNAHLRAMTEDGDAHRVGRSRDGFLRRIWKCVRLELAYLWWYKSTSKARKLRNGGQIEAKRQQAKKDKEESRRSSMAQLEEPKALTDGQALAEKQGLGLWRIMPYRYPPEAATSAKLRREIMARVTHSEDARKVHTFFMSPYTHKPVPPAWGGDFAPFEALDGTALARVLRNVGCEDPDAFSVVLAGLYGTELMPTGVRRSPDGYFHGDGSGDDLDATPWQPTPHFGAASHVERALGLTESRIGSEMRKLTHAQAHLHGMMANMQRQAQGVDRAQQVILQYLIAGQAKQRLNETNAIVAAKQHKHFFPDG